jgi:ubiquinone/menaquinone biosynthesis C-methylase UbiE
MNNTAQDQYLSARYNNRTRWMNFWHQIDEIQRLQPKTILEIGKGSGFVADYLQKRGYNITTVDIDPSTHPDIVASCEQLPVADKSYDLVVAAEVLEHLPFERVESTLRELRRVATNALITLPHAGSALILRLRLPWIIDRTLFVKVPFFWKQHVNKHGNITGHAWELGKKTFSRARMRQLLTSANFTIVKEKIFPDDYIHIFYVLK